jgi:hypothetical protein
MKKLMLLALALVIGTASLFAANVNPDDSKKDMRAQIVKLLDAPSYATEKVIDVAITFTFSSEGEIVVLKVDAWDGEVLNYVRRNLNYKKIQNPGIKDKLYSMSLKVSPA